MAADSTEIDYIFKRFNDILKWSFVILDPNKTTSKIIIHRVWIVLSIAVVNYETYSSFVWFVKGIIRGENLTFITYIAPCVTFTMMWGYKTYSLLSNQQAVNDIKSTLIRIRAKQNKKQSAKKNEFLKKSTERLQSILKGLRVVNIILVVFFPGMTLVPVAVTYLKTGEFHPLLPLLSEYPYDQFDPKIWPFSFIGQFYAISVTVLANGGVDFYYYIFCTYIHIHFVLLQHDFEDLIPSQDISRGYVVENDEMKKEFENLILEHEQILFCAGLLERIYTKSIFFMFLVSSFIICLTGFNAMTLNDNKAMMVSFVVFLIQMLFMVFFICYFGDMLMTSSMKVADGIYNSRWCNADYKLRKKLNIVQHRALKPFKLTAYGFADVNLAAFTSILSTSWRYFALLNTLYQSEEKIS